VELRDVNFQYPGRSDSTLKSVDLRLQRGAVTALVGENGAGKSTVAKIVAGLYSPSSGAALRQPDASIAVLFQDFVTLEMSVRDNITIGAEANEARLVDAVRRSGFESVLARMPDGLDTLLGRSANDGIELSGGESQRLALARALYRDADVIILDEPTASLDPLAVRAFYEDVLVARRARTAVLLISHRLASVSHADEIVVLDHGEVRERGSHAELMRTRGAYHRMFTTQASEFVGPRSASNGRSSSGHTGPTSPAPVEKPAQPRRRGTR
jgi:ABC-type multidrug transport system fused ATPase/permease subunit